MAQNIESFEFHIPHIVDGDLVDMKTYGYKCRTCDEVWYPAYYGQPANQWDSSWRHRCPKAPVTPPVLEAAAEQEAWDV